MTLKALQTDVGHCTLPSTYTFGGTKPESELVTNSGSDRKRQSELYKYSVAILPPRTVHALYVNEFIQSTLLLFIYLFTVTAILFIIVDLFMLSC
jgi:hypothetical protein